MKKKIIITLTICLFAAGSIINVHLAQNDYNMDVSLADISVMAQADEESGSSCAAGGTGSTSCSYSATVLGVSLSCSVTCESGYYACCGLNAKLEAVYCDCVPYS